MVGTEAWLLDFMSCILFLVAAIVTAAALGLLLVSC